MDQKSFPVIETNRLLLKMPEYKQWKVILHLRSDEKINQFIQRKKAETKEDALHFIDMITDQIKNETSVNWFIYSKASNEMIGTICLWNISEDRMTAEVGYDLKTAFQGKGLMDETLKAVIAYGFKEMHLTKIEAFTSKHNRSSLALLLRNNFKLNAQRNDPENEDNAILELVEN